MLINLFYCKMILCILFVEICFFDKGNLTIWKKRVYVAKQLIIFA